jgi:hypothetical protein
MDCAPNLSLSGRQVTRCLLFSLLCASVANINNESAEKWRSSVCFMIFTFVIADTSSRNGPHMKHFLNLMYFNYCVGDKLPCF